MAKQSGLHQIRGKVGEHSYYRQTGIESGLVRSINQALSGRVKTGEEYANTRLNNAEFGQAGRVAAVLGQFVTPKYRPMVLPFSQSKMLKSLIEVLKSQNGTWGQRNIPTTDATPFIQALNLTRKNSPAVFAPEYSFNAEENFEVVVDTNLYDNWLTSIGADGCRVVCLACRPWIGNFVSDTNKYAPSYARANIYTDELPLGSDTVQFDYEFRPAPSGGWPATSVDFFVVVYLPYRMVSNRPYILQEYCTFDAVAVPE